jgi:hypothetical protein
MLQDKRKVIGLPILVDHSGMNTNSHEFLNFMVINSSSFLFSFINKLKNTVSLKNKYDKVVLSFFHVINSSSFIVKFGVSCGRRFKQLIVVMKRSLFVLY